MMGIKNLGIMQKEKVFYKSRCLFFVLMVVALSLVTTKSFANHLMISNFEVYSVNASSNTITFTCDVSWENSWRNTNNFDSVWVFMKYSTDAGITWSHASMSSSGITPSGFNAPTNFEIHVPSDEKGLFLQRTDLSSGNVSAENVRFVWDYGQDGLTDEVAAAANTLNKVFGVEMVYIPEGSFYAGDGNSASAYRFKQGSADNDPWYIQSENALSTTNTANDGYYYQSSGATAESNSGDVFMLSASFPKGYNDFYLMKYELTEGQWASFFNALSSAAKSNRDITSAGQGGKNSDVVVDRNTIAWDSSKPQLPATTSRPDRPVSYISWPDLLAYADWAGLRPVTELEYEKAARGKDVAAVVDEYAWGKTTYNQAEANEIVPDSDEDGTEIILDSAANINKNNLGWTTGDGRAAGAAVGQKGPLRVGIFAESADTRSSSGAGYYGNMELSGNLSEMFVSIGKAQGRQFLGSHGDGNLTTLSGYEGNATNEDWPGIDATDSSYGVTATSGSGYRGGDFQSSSTQMYQISSRTYASRDPDGEGYAQRYDAALGIYQGGRLGRSAP